MCKSLFITLFILLTCYVLHSTTPNIVEGYFWQVPYGVEEPTPTHYNPGPDSPVMITLIGSNGVYVANISPKETPFSPAGQSPMQGYYVLENSHEAVIAAGTLYEYVVQWNGQNVVVSPALYNHKIDFTIVIKQTD